MWPRVRHLPPPIWEGRRSGSRPTTKSKATSVDSPTCRPRPFRRSPWAFNWGWARPDLVRYNRVEGPAVGGRIESALNGRHSLGVSGFFGLADLTAEGTARLAALDGAPAADPWGLPRAEADRSRRPATSDFGNSLNAFLFGRDDGEYYRATGGDLTWRPPGRRSPIASCFRAYGERHASVASETDFALFHAFHVATGNFGPNRGKRIGRRGSGCGAEAVALVGKRSHRGATRGRTATVAGRCGGTDRRGCQRTAIPAGECNRTQPSSP